VILAIGELQPMLQLRFSNIILLRTKLVRLRTKTSHTLTYKQTKSYFFLSKLLNADLGKIWPKICLRSLQIAIGN
jgi:hypothetical protein